MKTLASILVLLFLTNICFAQNVEEPGAIQSTAALLEEEILAETNQSIVNQQGADNQVSVIQRQEGIEANLAKVLQFGNFNEALLSQQGSGNNSAVSQNGKGNLYNLILEGDNNDIGIIQNGDNNIIRQNLNGVTDAKLEVVQEGNENEVEQEFTGQSNLNMQIIQNGNGLKAIIRQ